MSIHGQVNGEQQNNKEDDKDLGYDSESLDKDDTDRLANNSEIKEGSNEDKEYESESNIEIKENVMTNDNEDKLSSNTHILIQLKIIMAGKLASNVKLEENNMITDEDVHQEGNNLFYNQDFNRLFQKISAGFGSSLIKLNFGKKSVQIFIFKQFFFL
jgi:hypothetical protein